MMRPRRSFSIRRRQALDMRKTEVKLVAITWSQSSIRMRTKSVSRVMAALLMRIVGRPSPASRSATSAATEVASPASNTAPRPVRPCAANSALMAAAPAALVAVPTTRAPALPRASAMARPMPREAPVTRARSFSSMDSSSAAGERSLHACRVLKREARKIRAPLDTTVERGQHLAGAAFNERLDMGCNDRAHGLGPMHRACQLAPQQRPNILGIGMRGGIDRAHEGNARHAHGDPRQALAQAARGRLHQTAVRWHAHGQWHGAFGAARNRGLNGALHRIVVAGNDDLAWAVEIDRFDDRALRSLKTRRFNLRIVEAETGHNRAAAARNGFLHRLGAT